MGETSLTYGHQLFDLMGEMLKGKTAGEICEQVERISRGVLQGCLTLEQCVVALAVALTRKVIPQAGKIFLETRNVGSVQDLRKAWETWMSGRQKGNSLSRGLVRPARGGVMVGLVSREVMEEERLRVFRVG